MGSETKGYQQLRQLDDGLPERRLSFFVAFHCVHCSRCRGHICGSPEEEKRKWHRMKVESIFKKIYSHK